MINLINEFVNYRTWALIGASTNPQKYGNIIFKDLTSAGYTVYPINPHGGEIAGHKLYRSLQELPQKPEVVDIVVPPKITEQVVQDCYEYGIRRIWMQPGAESLAAIKFCQQHGIAVVYDACAMVYKRYWD